MIPQEDLDVSWTAGEQSKRRRPDAEAHDLQVRAFAQHAFGLPDVAFHALC